MDMTHFKVWTSLSSLTPHLAVHLVDSFLVVKDLQCLPTSFYQCFILCFITLHLSQMKDATRYLSFFCIILDYIALTLCMYLYFVFLFFKPSIYAYLYHFVPSSLLPLHVRLLSKLYLDFSLLARTK